MPTIYRPVLDAPDYYAGMNGSIVSGKTGRVLKQTLNVKSGYPYVYVSLEGKRRNRTVHGMVAPAFLGECPEGLEILHADGDYSNPALINLGYGTKSQNSLDAVRHGTHSAMGERHPRAVLNNVKVAKIRQLYTEGWAQKDIAEQMGVSRVLIHNVVHRKSWRHVK